MHIKREAVVALCGAVLLTAASARAEDDWTGERADAKVAHARRVEREPAPTFAYEFAMGFTGGVVDPSALPLVFRAGEVAAVAGATGLGAPFGGPNLRTLITTGPAWEARATQSHVRFTLGLQKPFAQFRQGTLDAPVETMGATLQVSPRSLSLWVIRFGLGGEATFGRVTPFADVLGDVQLATADLSVDGQPGTWTSAGFGFLVRAGARVRVDRYLSVGLAGEYGLVGAPRYGATLLVGWVFPID